MINIAIVDDEEQCITHLQQILKSYKHSQRFAVQEFSSGESFLANYKHFDILFVDIELKGMLGVDLAVKIREIDKNILIVFTTSHTSYISDAFSSIPFQYLIKPVKENLLHRELDRAMIDIESRNRVLETSWNGKKDIIPINEIFYIECYLRKILIVTKEQSYNSSGKINDLHKGLMEYHFVRSHNSFLVNMKFIKKIDSTNVVLKDGTTVPISKKYMKEVRSQYAEMLSGVKI